MTHPYDCQTCGACCNPAQRFVMTLPIQDQDLPRFTDLEKRHWIKPLEGGTPGSLQKLRFLESTTGTRCPFLVGDAGTECACTIYDRRPINCQWFPPGHYDCKKMRREYGLEVRIEV